MNILVFLIGSIRGNDKTWKTLKKNILDINNADLGLCYSGKKNNKNNYLYNIAKYIIESEIYDDWSDYFDKVSEEINNNKNYKWRNILNKMNWHWSGGGVFGGLKYKNCPNIKAINDKGIICGGGIYILFIYHHMIRNFIIKNKLLDKYERFIIAITDLLYFSSINLNNLSNEHIWIPKKYLQKFGVDSSFIVINKDNILKYLNTLGELVKNPEIMLNHQMNQVNTCLAIKDFINPEVYMKLFLIRNNLFDKIKTFEPYFLMLITKKNDNTKKFNFKKCKYLKYFNVYVRYKYEYETICKKYPNLKNKFLY